MIVTGPRGCLYLSLLKGKFSNDIFSNAAQTQPLDRSLYQMLRFGAWLFVHLEARNVAPRESLALKIMNSVTMVYFLKEKKLGSVAVAKT